MDRSTRQTDKEIEGLNNTINQLNLTQIETSTNKSTIQSLLKGT